jgi:dTDP-4-dehydrorhamnose reductase
MATPPSKKRLLLTGASGFLGWHLCRQAPPEWEIWGVVFSGTLAIPGITVLPADLRKYQDLKTVFQTIRPQAVIHTAAFSDPNYCQLHPHETEALNVTASIHLAGLCADLLIPCLFTSSDLVFDGLRAPYCEEDPPNPINFYGEQKWQAEEGMGNTYPQTIICRLPLMFGEAGPTAKSFLQPMLKALRGKGSLSLFVDEFRTPVSGKTAAQGLYWALEHIEGIIHLGGRKRISRYDFGLLLKKCLKSPPATLIPCSQKDLPQAAPRPVDVSLNSTKAFSLGYQPPSLKEDLLEALDHRPF